MEQFFHTLRAFYHGRVYPILVAALIFVGHSTELEVLFGGLMLLTLIGGCLVCHDLRFAITPFLCTIFAVAINHSPNVPNYSRYYLEPTVLTTLVILIVLLIGALIFFAIRNRALAARPKRGGAWVGMATFCAALCFNGLFSHNYVIHNFFYVCSFLLSMLAVYLLFSAYVLFDRDTLEYFMYCLVVSVMLIAAELVFAYLTTVRFVEGEVVKESVVLGWGVWTAIGGMLAMLMPSCFYFAASHKRGFVGYLLGFFVYFCILLSQSRGALLVGSVLLVLCLASLCLWGENKKRNRIYTAVLLCLGVLGGLFLREQLMGLLQNFLTYGFGDNGRFEKWKIGWGHFLANPVFGSGFYEFNNEAEWAKDVYPYLYHNTLIQLLGATGIFGFVAYLYHRYTTWRLVLHRPSIYKTFLGIGILGLLLFSLLDVLFFNTYPTIFYSLMLLFMERSEEITE